MRNLHSVRRDQSYKLFTGNQQPQSQKPMWIMVVYVLIVVVSEAIVVAIGPNLRSNLPDTQFTSFAIAFLCRPLVRLDSCGAVDRAQTRKEGKTRIKLQMDAYLQFLTDEFTVLGVTIQTWVVLVAALFIIWVAHTYQDHRRSKAPSHDPHVPLWVKSGHLAVQSFMSALPQ
jgi:hypothetical protein